MAATKDLKSILSKLKYEDDARVVEQIGEQTKRLQSRMVGIRRKLAILSGKGGVGKSMTTVNLALAIARRNQKVAILDVDLNGPCIPHMLGIRGRELTMTPEGALPPIGPLGVKVGSMDFFLGDMSPVRWNRPMDLSPVWLGTLEMTVIREFLADMVWGEVDYLLIDLPPGAAADKPPVIANFIPDLDGAVIVTTPSEMAMDVVCKSVLYARSLNIKILGLIENMSKFLCPECGTESQLFESQADEMCETLDIPFLGRIPFDRDLAGSFDKGKPLLDPAHPTIARYAEISGRILEILDFKKLLAEKL